MSRFGYGVVCTVGAALFAVTSVFGQDPEPLALGDSGADLVYTPVTPCRIIDTRVPGGALAPGAPRDFHVVGTAGFDTQGGNVGGCGIPSGATAVMLNFVAVSPAGPGNLRAWAFGQTAPLAAVLNYAAVSGLAIANGVVVPLCNPASGPCALDLTVSANASATHLVVDALGYMQAVGPGSVTTDLLGDGAVTLAKLGSDAVDASKIVDGSVGSAEVDSSQVQLRVSASCAPGSSIRLINANGTVSCETDDVAAGTVTSITAGTGLSGGTITSSGTISVNFAGSGSASTAARSDHTHTPPVVTHTKTISALTCIAQGGAFSGDTLACGGPMLRTDGDSNFPCVVRARTTRDTWLCNLDLPDNAQITNITAHVHDGANDGYMEALVWRINATTLIGIDTFSNFGGTWQSSGTAFSAGQTSFPIFNAATPHPVSGAHHYVIGFGLKSPTAQIVWAEGFRVTYTTQ